MAIGGPRYTDRIGGELLDYLHPYAGCAKAKKDLRGWEDWKIDDPGSIKGIAAEVIAATGPKLLDNSALVLF